LASEPLMQTNLPLENRRQGKVRDTYEATLDDGTPVLLIIATDRISSFDVVMPNGVPNKGIVLTQISKFWFDMIEQKLGDRLTHHLIAIDADDVAGLSDTDKEVLRQRVMVGKRCNVVPIECVVRGYLAGSGWVEYQQNQSVCGVSLPDGLKQCSKLPEPIFTPATKAEEGHDENISFERACELVGEELMTELRDMSIAIYRMGHDYALSRGIILADTKFEFGIPLENSSSEPILIDEVMTPDSSRFWPVDQYEEGCDQPSYDKQYVRNYLLQLVEQGKWHKSPPGPILPKEIVENSLTRYLQAYEALTGSKLTF